MSLAKAARSRRENARARRAAARHARLINQAIDSAASPAMRNDLIMAAQRQYPFGLR
ncbi:hypothetical protein [Auraticoccus cholistanensis]|uniref:hypothetical protein n=1 Tax=Auraticoccus cholistanensis TaxID=2656650 RepID=UPI0018D1F867|nr:hypothetical protein [Auraticoccus cholistanensis]